MNFSFRKLPFFIFLGCLLLSFQAFSARAQTAASDSASTEVAGWLLGPDGCSVTCTGSTWACCNLISKGGCHCWEQTELPDKCASGGAHTSSCSIASPEPAP